MGFKPPLGNVIIGLVARNGHGKTLGAVARYVVPCWAMGKPVASNIELRPEALGYKPELYVPLGCMDDLLRVGQFVDPDQSITGNRPAMLLLDEITTILSSRESSSASPELVRLVHQLRKPKVSPVVWTAVAYGRADKTLREATTHMVEVKPVLPSVLSYRSGRFEWPQHRAFRYRVYEGPEYEAYHGEPAADLQAMEAIKEAPRPKKTALLWRPKQLAAAFAAYDTQESVQLLDRPCDRCGGKVGRKACRCK